MLSLAWRQGRRLYVRTVLTVYCRLLCADRPKPLPCAWSAMKKAPLHPYKHLAHIRIPGSSLNGPENAPTHVCGGAQNNGRTGFCQDGDVLFAVPGNCPGQGAQGTNWMPCACAANLALTFVTLLPVGPGVRLGPVQESGATLHQVCGAPLQTDGQFPRAGRYRRDRTASIPNAPPRFGPGTTGGWDKWNFLILF